MSPIGRVFVVLNLVLASGFVAFAGTFLKNHTNWKTQHEEVTTKFDKSKLDYEATLGTRDKDVGEARRELSRYKEKADRAEAELANARATNEDLGKKLASLEADIKTMKSDYSAVRSTVDEAFKASKSTLDLAQTNAEEKHKALNAQKEAEAKLEQATNKIADLDRKIADLNGVVAVKDTDIGQLKIIVANAQARFPGILAVSAPDAEGRVSHVDASSKLATIELTGKRGEGLQKGHSFAIYSDRGYKAEAVITELDDRFAFCRITATKEGAVIQVGDRAATNPSR